MSKRDFDCSSSDSSPSDTEGAQAAQATEDDDDDDNSVESDSEEDEPSASTSSSKPQPAKRMKRPNRPREWKEYNRWSRAQHTDTEIMAFIRAALAELNKKAGITSLPPRHQDRKKGDIYGDWMYRTAWTTCKGAVNNTSLQCPLVERCGCPCEAKIEESPGQFILYIHAEHTAEDHKADKAKFLKYDTQEFIRKAVKTAPMNTASELIKNVQDSPTKQIDPKLKKSVERLIRRERSKILTVECEGIVLNSDLGSLKQLADKIYMKNALQAHIAGVSGGPPDCIDCFRVFCIGKTFVGVERCAMLAFSNVWNLLNMIRSVASGFSVMLHGDVTSKASAAAFNRLGFGVNMLGGHCMPWVTALIPAETESEQTYSEVYKAAHAATRRILQLPLCVRAECKTCTYIKELLDNQTVLAMMNGRPYKELKELPIDKPLGDNCTGFQNFCEHVLKVPARVCNTHVSAIPANNGSFKKRFASQDVYKQFYDFVVRVKDCSFEDAGVKLQDRLCDWLASSGEESVADWFHEWWCGDVKGRWLLGNGGYGLIANNQGLESRWRWERNSISGGRQVSLNLCK